MVRLHCTPAVLLLLTADSAILWLVHKPAFGRPLAFAWWSTFIDGNGEKTLTATRGAADCMSITSGGLCEPRKWDHGRLRDLDHAGQNPRICLAALHPLDALATFFLPSRKPRRWRCNQARFLPPRSESRAEPMRSSENAKGKLLDSVGEPATGKENTQLEIDSPNQFFEPNIGV
jgi:hypothetical protein